MALSIFTKVQSHRHYLLPEHSITPKGTPFPLSSHFPFPSPHSPQQPSVCFLFLWICLFWNFHINGIIHHASHCVWFLSLNLMLSRFLHVVAYQCFVPFSWLNNIPLYEYTTFSLSRHCFDSFSYMTCYKVGTIIIPHFIGEKTGVQRGQASCSRLHS